VNSNVKTDSKNNKFPLLEKAKSLPTTPGCYLMLGKEKQVLYVGKAKNLKNRVSSYFNQSSKSPKTEIMVSKVVNFEIILTGNEAEALVLENNLIKKNTPKYNIRMRDDKSYPYVVVDWSEPYPTLKYLRRVKREGKREIFGPYPTGSNIGEILRLMNKLFGLRDCSLADFKSRKEPCLLYQLKQCTGPCLNLILQDDYQQRLKIALGLFKGKGKQVREYLYQQMLKFADNEEFEAAAFLRDGLDEIEKFISFSPQKNVDLGNETRDLDIIAYHQGDIEIDISFYLMRNGVLLGNKSFHFPIADCNEDIEEEISRFVFQYYANSHDSLPSLIVSSLSLENRQLLEAGLSFLLQEKNIKARVEVRNPGRNFQALYNLSLQQAIEGQRIRITNQASVYLGLNKLKELLSLKERPKRLECFDVAVWQGSAPTAAKILFEEGIALKSGYRHYHLSQREEGNNDFAMLQEALERRLKEQNLPDVFIVDGGKGQLNVFLKVLQKLEVSVPVVALAKEKTKSDFKSKEIISSQERLFIPGRSNPYILGKNRALLTILTQMRDEAHRFSRKLHHKVFDREQHGHWLDAVPGIGAKIKSRILNKMNMNIAELKALTVAEISAHFEISVSLAQALKQALKK